jgi:hypothetical protein
MSLRLEPPPVTADRASDTGTVLLATFDVPFDEAAATFAVDSAAESGRSLIIANIVELEPLPLSIRWGCDSLDYSPLLESSLTAPARRAMSCGVPVERLRVKTFRRVEAMIELSKERRVKLLVIGPDRDRVRPMLYRKAAAAARDQLSCLVWLSWDVPPL